MTTACAIASVVSVHADQGRVGQFVVAFEQTLVSSRCRGVRYRSSPPLPSEEQ
jgi:hypothetical protein